MSPIGETATQTAPGRTSGIAPDSRHSARNDALHKQLLDLIRGASK